VADKLSIKVTIANRVYPLSIDRTEEEGVRKAAAAVNDLVKEYENSYSVKDRQDLLAMCALEFATRKLESELDDNSSGVDLKNDIQKLNHQIADFIAEH